MPVIIQPNLTDGNRFHVLRQQAQRIEVVTLRLIRLLRMHADGVVHSRIFSGKRLARAGGRQIGRGVDDMRNPAVREQRRQQRVAVAVKARVVIMGVRIKHPRTLSGQCCR